MAYVDLAATKVQGKPDIKHFAMPAARRSGETAPRPLLPSFLYLPGAHDLPAGATAMPWDPACPYAVGEFARNHGSRVPGRLVTSASPGSVTPASIARRRSCLERTARCATHFPC